MIFSVWKPGVEINESIIVRETALSEMQDH